MIKASCCEVEWRVFDGLEQAYLLQNRPEEALLWSDRKRMSHLSNMLRRLSAPGSNNTNSSSPLRRMDAGLARVMARAGVDILVAFSLQWDDTTDAHVYVATRPAGGEEGDGAAATVTCRPMKLSPALLAVLTAQQSKYHQLVSDGVSDTPLVPQLLSQTAERESERLLRGRAAEQDKQSTREAAVGNLMAPVTADMELGDVQRMIDEGASHRLSNSAAGATQLCSSIDWGVLLSELSDALLGPIAEELRAALDAFRGAADVPTLCIVPDGFLSNVPFAALYAPTSSSSSSKTHLIDVAAVALSPSIELLHHLSNRSSGGVDSNNSSNSSAARATVISAAAVPKSSSDDSNTVVHACLQPQEPESVSKQLSALLFPAAAPQPCGVLTLDLPLSFDMREDFSGSLDLSCCIAEQFRRVSPIVGETERFLVPAEWIASRGKCMSARDFTVWMAAKQQQGANSAAAPVAASVLWLPSETDFCYRVVHETCVPITRTFFLAGYPRLVSTLWRGPEFDVIDAELRSGNWMRPSSSSCPSVAHAFRRTILDLRAKKGVSLHSWASLRLIGLA